MRKLVMGIFLIVIGALLLILGIVVVVSKSSDGEQIRETNDYAAADNNAERSVAPDVPETVKEDVQAKNASKEKGDAYENFVVNLLADWRLSLLDRTQDAVSSAGVVAESCKNPDLHVGQKRGKGNIDYYFECKYRSRWDDGKVTFEGWQLDRYRQFQRDNQRKVIIALGVGGSPAAPATFMLVPLDSVKDNTIKQVHTQFVVQPNSTALVEYMDNYFTKVFDVAKERRQSKNKD